MTASTPRPAERPLDDHHRDGLAHRAERVEAVVLELERRALFYTQRHAQVPDALRHATGDFRRELRALRRRIEHRNALER